MVLREKDTKEIINFVKEEPRTMQDIARKSGRSWLTADSYVKEIIKDTGRIDMRTFRKGTQGALKIVFYTNPETLNTTETKEKLMSHIKAGRKKLDFDFMDIFQFIENKEKEAFTSKSITLPEKEIENAREKVFIFSGNLSFINSKKILELFEKILNRNVKVKILVRVNLGSISNINHLRILKEKYKDNLEIKHAYHPLRGTIVDNSFAQFRNEEKTENYKKDELSEDTTIHYIIRDEDWISWLQNIFWFYFRTSIDLEERLKDYNSIKNK